MKYKHGKEASELLYLCKESTQQTKNPIILRLIQLLESNKETISILEDNSEEVE